MEPYRFEYEGHTVEFSRGTVRTALEEQRILAKLVDAHDYSVGDVPADDWGNFTEYAAAMARTKSNAPWRGHSNMSAEQLKDAYEAFLDEGEELWTAFRVGVGATRPPKKTLPLPPAT